MTSRDQDPGPGCRKQVEGIDGLLDVRRGDDRWHLLDLAIQSGDRDLRRPDGIESAADLRRSPEKTNTESTIHGVQARRTATGGQRCHHGLRGRRRRRCGLICHGRHGRGRPPDTQERRQRGHRYERRDDVHEPGSMEVRDEILRDRERRPGNEDWRPDLDHLAEADEGPNEPERHDDGKERELPADHAAQLMQVEAGDGGERDDRRAEGAECDWGGVGDQRQARRCQRREAEPDQHRRRDRDGRAEPGRAFEKGAQAKRDEQELEAAVVADGADGPLKDGEFALLARELIQENDVENDPADGQQSEGRAVSGSQTRHVRRHSVGKDRNQERGDEA